MAGIGVSGSSSFSSSSGATSQKAINQKFSQMFGKKNLAGTDLVKPVFAVGCAVIGLLMIKKKFGK